MEVKIIEMAQQETNKFSNMVVAQIREINKANDHLIEMAKELNNSVRVNGDRIKEQVIEYAKQEAKTMLTNLLPENDETFDVKIKDYALNSHDFNIDGLILAEPKSLIDLINDSFQAGYKYAKERIKNEL